MSSHTATRDESVIALDGLEKSYRVWYRNETIHALRGISFTVKPGEIFGFLGPNGAGKTTTVKILLGLLRSDAGSISILHGKPGDLAVQAHIGYMPERALLPQYLKLREMLELFGGLSGLSGRTLKEAVAKSLEAVELTDVANRSLDTFSKGMLQRATLAQSLVHDPSLLLLDEPAIGLDPVSRRKLRDQLLELRSQGKTIFLNSHELEVVQLICDRFAILNKGRLLAIESIDTLRQVGKYAISLDHLPPEPTAVFSQIPGILGFDEERKQLTVTCENSLRLNQIIDSLRQAQLLITSVMPISLSLEEFFLHYISDDSPPDVG